MLYRHIEEELRAFIRLMPVSLLIGARQTGKTTLVESLTKKDSWNYVTCDEEITLSSATRDPSGWLSSLPKPIIIDEVQRIPEIFLSIKRDVDLHRKPGRYLLTGSANPLLLPKLGDSLAGRMGVVTLFPFSQGEIAKKVEDFIPKAFGDGTFYSSYPKLSRENLCERILKGGFPTIYELKSFEDVNRWVGSYLQTMMERDVRDIANIEGLREFPRLFRLIATRSSMLLNTSDISRTLGMVGMTLNRYLRLLEILFFVYLLPAWYSNLGKRLIKSPKIHVCDTAIMARLLEMDQNRLMNDPMILGQFLETFVFIELIKQKSWSKVRVELYHFRDGDYEVDFILEKADGTIVGIEVKSAKSIKLEDIKGLIHLKKIAGPKFTKGIVLHLGDQTTHLDKDIIALPLQALWS